MAIRESLRWHGRLHVSKNAAIRTGLYVGFALSVIFATWVLVANRVPAFERFALERNIAAAAALGLLALVPVLRFIRSPACLLASSLIAWGILSLTYRLLSLYFWGLDSRYSPFQIFMLGAVVYMIAATISWIGTVIWRTRHVHISHSNHRVTSSE
jgi:hypothetical protein